MTKTFVVPPRSCDLVGCFPWVFFLVVWLFGYFFFQIILFKNHDKCRILPFGAFIFSYNVEKDQKFKFLIN